MGASGARARITYFVIPAKAGIPNNARDAHRPGWIPACAGMTGRIDPATARTMRVAIVGAGYSGTIAAVEIARAAPGAEILLIEKSGRFAAGAAYGTRSPGH